MSEKSLLAAKQFLEDETQFHLGFLPTEQSSPLTRNLDKEFARGSVYGVQNLQSVDRNVAEMAQKVFKSPEYRKLIECGEKVIRSGGKVVFSGCGATGRLSILLECMYREGCSRYPELAQYSNSVFSIMTGGDYALVRSVEFFEDYQSFGRQQVCELGMQKGDMLVAITEGGETSSVLGTLFEALDRGCQGFLLFNNPADLLAAHLERSRRAITDPRVTVLDLACGPMALAGSTRMQATTSEQLIAGGALESIVNRLLGRPELDYADLFCKLLDDLESAPAVESIARYVDIEADCYDKKGYVTYFAKDYLLDIFTDTTERSPTFKLPPFRKMDDTVSPRPWAFVKNPLITTGEVWQQNMKRPLRCLEWTPELYKKMDSPAQIIANPPAIGSAELLKFPVGNEFLSDRIVSAADVAVSVTLSTGRGNDELIKEFDSLKGKFSTSCQLVIGNAESAPADALKVPCRLESAPLELMSHMAVKLVLNTISTGVMEKLGRVTGNWMSFVYVTNKKLIDRAIRLISEIGAMEYPQACNMLFEAVEITAAMPEDHPDKMPVVQYVLHKMLK